MTRMVQVTLDESERLVVEEALEHVDREYAFTRAPEHYIVHDLLGRIREADRHE